MAGTTTDREKLAETPLFDTAFLQCLERLQLRIQSRSQFEGSGGNPIRQAGQGREFSEYRDYSPGDDFRAVDWMAYGRTGRLFTKLHKAEKESALHVLIDSSLSMRHVGVPGKFRMTCRFAAAVAVICALRNHRVNLAWFHGALDCQSGMVQGSKSLPRIFEFFATPPAFPQPTDLGNVARQWCGGVPCRDAVVLVSDFLDESRVDVAAKMFACAGFTASFVQVLGREEEKPAFFDAVRLRDSETGEATEVFFDAAERECYASSLTKFLDRTEASAKQSGGGYLLLKESESFEEAIISGLKSIGILA